MTERIQITLDPPRPAPGKPGVFTFVSRNGEPLHSDDFRPTSANKVKAFISETIRRGFPDGKPKKRVEEVQKELERQFAAWSVTPPGPDPAEPAEERKRVEPAEVDVSQVVRPELFHTHEVSGLTIPLMTSAGDKLVPRWRTLLRWADGRREVIDKPEVITLGNGRRLHVFPDPGEPGASEPPMWSAESRRRWLEGQVETQPAELFRALCEQIAFYLDFDPDTAQGTTATLALWIVLTYLYPAWDAVPYIYVGGPMNSGKSRLLEVIAKLAFRPLVSANVTAPAMFRTLHVRGGTMLYDEAESLRQDRPDMKEVNSVFLSGYKRGTPATRLEPVGDAFRPVQFDVYGPKVLACIAGLPPTLASRCITVMMFRAAADSEKPKRRLDASAERWASLRDDLHVLALEFGAECAGLARDQTVVPPTVTNRNFELWQPLLALAKWFESRGAGGLLGLAQSHAVRSVSDAVDDAIPEPDEILLEILAEKIKQGERPTAGEILDVAREKAPSTFDKWAATTVTRRFKTYSIEAPKKSNGERRYRHVTPMMLRRIQDRYHIDLGCDATQTQGTDPERP